MSVNFYRAIFTSILITTVVSVQATEIRFQQKVTVKTSMVKLGEIAEIRNGNEQQMAQLAELMLMPGPTPGKTTRIDFQMVRSRLKALGVNLSQVQFTGSSVVLVTRIGSKKGRGYQFGSKRPQATLSMQRKAKQLLNNAMQQYLRGRGVSLATHQIELQLHDADIPLVISGRTSGYKIEGGSAPWQKGQNFIAHFQDHREKVHQIRFAARVVPKPRAWATRLPLPRGHIIKPSDLEMKLIDNNAPAIRYEEIVGTETTRAIRQNKIVTLQDIRSVPLIRPNDIVTVTSKVGGVSVKRQMKARGIGSRGETVTLVSLDGRQLLQAQVTAFHEAEVSNRTANINSGDATRNKIVFQATRQPARQLGRQQPPTSYRNPLPYKSRTESGVRQAGYQQHAMPNHAPQATHQRPVQTRRGQFLPSQYETKPLPREHRTMENQATDRVQ